MLFRTHLAFSFLIALVIVDFFKISNQILFVIVFLFFAILPDIDEYSSKISKLFRPLAFIVKLLFRHRGFFHSIYIPLIISLFLFSIEQKMLSLAALIGYLSHLILDAFSRQGISPLSPIINKKFRGIIKVGSFYENILFLLFFILVILKLV